MGSWPAFIGTLPGWITASGMTTLVGLVLWYCLGLRKLQIAADTVEVEAHKVDRADEADIRDHYAEELHDIREAFAASALRQLDRERQIEERYRGLLSESDQAHEDCKRDRDELREKVSALRDLVDGLRRIITQASASQAILISDTTSPEVEAAARRVELLFRPKEEGETRQNQRAKRRSR